MAAAADIDLTKGRISGHFRTLAIPAAIGMLFSTLYNVVDMFFAGLLSTSAQAGLALGTQAFFLSIAVGVGLGAAMGALVGNALGAGDRAMARTLATQGISFGALAALALGFVGQFYGPALIGLVSEPGAYRDDGVRYFQILSFALPGFILAFGCNGILQAHGDSRSMQRALVVAFFANIALNPLFVFGIPGVWSGIGFDGLAASTVVSQTGVMIYMIRQVLARGSMQGVRRGHFSPDMGRFAEILKQLLPTGLSFLVMLLAGFVMQFFLKDFGEHAIAGYGVAIRLEQILLLPILGMTGALLPIAAQNYGAGQHARVREAFFFCLRTGAVLCAIAFPILWLLGGPVLSLFTDDADVVRVGVSYLRVESVILPVYMMLFAINSFLQALKRPIWTVWISLYRQGIGIAIFIWVFVRLLGFDELGVWLGTAAAVVTGGILGLTIARAIAHRDLGGFWRPVPPATSSPTG